jgi:predicted secreted protein
MRNLGLALLFWLMTAANSGAATIAPTLQDRQAFESGARQQEAINIFSDPRGCGIVLMRRYCREALAALVGNLAAVPGLEQFVATGNLDAYDKKWSDANAVGFTDAEWSGSPRKTWLRAAGAMYAAYYVPEWDAYSMMQVPVYRQLVHFAGSATPYDTLLSATDLKAGPNGIDVQGPARISKYFVPALGMVFVPEAEPAFILNPGPTLEAQLGVYASTAQEMFESPMVFLAPSSRAFLNELAIRLGDAKLGQQFLSASDPEEWRAAISDFQNLESAAIKAQRDKRQAAFLFGMFAAQAAYNAAVLRERPAAEQQLGVLQRTSAAVPTRVASRLTAVLAARGGWHDLNSAASALTLEIMQP